MNTRKVVKIYVLTTLLCIAFHAVYSLFGHGVSSPYMTYAFAYSFVLGVLGHSVLSRLHVEHRIAFNLYNAGIATLTVGSLLQGIMDIAGADTAYPVYYFLMGTLLVTVGVFMYVYARHQTPYRFGATGMDQRRNHR